MVAKVAVCCLPTFMRHRLLPDESPHDDFVYQPWLTANLSLNKNPADLEPPGHLAWDNVLFQSESLGYVVATHQSLNADPLKSTVWTWYRPFPKGEAAELREKLLSADWLDWSNAILDELELVHSDIREQCTQLDITVLGHGMIRPSVGFIWGKGCPRRGGRVVPFILVTVTCRECPYSKSLNFVVSWPQRTHWHPWAWDLRASCRRR